MEGKDNIKELFSQKLGNYEAPVNPELWASISSQVAAGATTTAATGLSLFAKVAIGLGISAAAITTVVVLSSSPEEIVSEEPLKEVQTETPTSNTTNNKKQVAEISTEKQLNTVEREDVPQHMGDSRNEISETSQPSVTPDPKPITPKVDPDVSMPNMTLRSPGVLGGNVDSKPTIVEGVTYGDWTNYGGAPTNAPDPELLEAETAKVEPIKRFVNVFTPNGQNPEFFLESEGLTDFSVVVFNPNGDIVYQSNDPNFRWDGRDIKTGKTVESGNYMYMVSAYDSEGNPYPIYERLTIIAN